MTGIYGWSTGTGGVHFYRLAEPLRVAREHGVDAADGQQLDDAICARYNTILTHMLHDEGCSEAWEKLAANGQHRLVFDIDDVMWAPDWEPFAKFYTPTVLERVYRNIELAHVVTTPSPVIAEHVSKWNPNVHVVPNTVPEYVLGIKPRTRHRRCVGFQGSAHHDVDFTDAVMQDLVRFIRDYPDWDLHLWGNHRIAGWPKGRVKVTGWQPNMRRYYQSLSMDMGIGPLQPTVFNSGKSSLRAVEYAALGIPAVVSDAPPYRGWVENGVTGLLVGRDGSWFDALKLLADNPVLRQEMGSEARRRAAKWTTEASIGRWAAAWNSA
jgi:glycosyltransferase involved in cell wall biosynthesis